MIQFAIYVLAFLILIGLCFWVLSKIPGIPDPIRQVIYIILVVVVVLVLVYFLLQFAGVVGTGYPGFPRPR